MAQGNDVVLASAAKSAAYTMIIQASVLNQTILFLTYEAFRRACISKADGRCWTQMVNLLWFVVPLGIFWSTVCGLLWLYVWERPDPSVVPFYDTAVYWFCFASFIEIVVQPLAIIGQILLFVELKAVIEGVTLVSRCITTVTLIVFFPQLGLKSFCIAQMIYALLMLALYFAYFVRRTSVHRKKTDFPFDSVRDFFPKFIPGKPFVGADLSRLVSSFFFQSFLKHFLTEGEKIVMTVLGVVSFADQGVYEVVSNLGSLPARMLFLPIEDAVYLFFTKTLNRGQLAVDQQKDSVQLARRVLESILKICVLIGLIFITFGYSYSFLLLDIYGGRLLSDGSGPVLMRWYCAYVLLTAMNGVTEGFKNATMSESQVNRFSRLMVLFTVVSMVTSWLFTIRYGSVGLIWSNCVNMSLRTAHSVHYIRQFFTGSGYSPHKALVPCLPVIVSFAVAGLVMIMSEAHLCCKFSLLWSAVHVTIGVFCLLTVVLAVWLFDRSLIESLRTEIYPLLRRKHTDKDKTT